MNVEKYIREQMPRTVRRNVKDEGTLIGLPYPYTVPCAEKHFNELYYWDTFFTNKALIALNDLEQVKNNVCDILFLIEKFGYMPNGNRTYLLERSQPPYAALMVEEVYQITKDLDFLQYAYRVLKKEYEFWMTHRVSKNGLNHYGCENNKKSCSGFYNDCVAARLKHIEGRQPVEAGKHYLAEAESGWDFNPRFHGFCLDYNPIDLNSNLYIYERLFAKYENLLTYSDGTEWENVAKIRRDRINKLLWDKEAGIYKDYNFETDTLSNIISAASFQPYYAGIVELAQKKHLQNLFYMLKSDGGVFTTTTMSDEKYQWQYPNIWAPCQYIAYKALQRYDYLTESDWIKEKYKQLVEKNFLNHGKLFEKYNGVTCSIEAASEYDTPEMLGWTAGVYMFFITIKTGYEKSRRSSEMKYSEKSKKV